MAYTSKYTGPEIDGALGGAIEHIADQTIHVTQTEKTAWNNKETPDGAQAKANIAKTEAMEEAAANAAVQASAAQSAAEQTAASNLAAHNTNAEAHSALLAEKADLIGGKVPINQLPSMDYDPAGSAETVQSNLDTHLANKNNPHEVTAAQVGARPNTWLPSAADVGAVPTNRTINGKALSTDISLTASDTGARPSTWTPTAAEIGAVPTTRTVNEKALNTDISLTATDVGARADTWLPTATEVGAIPTTAKGAANGVAELDAGGKVPMSQMPFDPSGGTTAEEVQANLDTHIADKHNPHAVTATQVGARPNTWLPTAAEIGAASKTTSNITLSANSWSNNTQTVSVNGIAENSLVIITPAPANYENYSSDGIYCNAQGSNTLTFTCKVVPTVDLIIQVTNMGVV